MTLPITLSTTESPSAVKPRSSEPQAGWFGMKVEELPRNMRVGGLSGVIVAELAPEGEAAGVGLRQGDIIVSVNQKKIGGVIDYGKAMKDAERKGSVAFLVRRGEASIYFALKLR